MLELFPFVHEVRCEATVGRAELTADDHRHGRRRPVPVSFGYHPYTRLPVRPRDEWQVTLAASDRLVLDDHSIPTGERAPVDREPFRLAGVSLDDAFERRLSETATFEAAAGERG